MKSFFKHLTLAAGLMAGASLTSVQAQSVLDFNDLGPSTIGTHMLDGYGGFNWTSSQWHYMSVASIPENTFLALSGTATSIYRPGGADFYFAGADYWSRRGLDANGTFYFILSRDGAMVYDGRNDPDGRQRFTSVPTTFRPNYSGPVDTVAVMFAQGGDDWDHLAMDNFRFSEAPVGEVPPTPPPTPTPAPTPAPAPATYKLVVKTSGKGSVAVSRTGSAFVAGTALTLTATPAAGSPWRGWTGDVTSSAQSIVVIMNKSMTVQANFK